MTVNAGTHGRPIYANVEAWRAEATARFGHDRGEWYFVCPACGHHASVNDFKKLGADGGRATVQCIGRVLNELGRHGEVYREPPEREAIDCDEDGEPVYDEDDGWVEPPSRRESGKPCDWSAGGLLGTLNEGTVIVEDDRRIWVFDFAEVKDGDRA